jgi:hypothetical protein
MEFERQELAMETLGMSLAEGKAVLKGVQEFVAEQQATEFLQGERTCRHCARHLSSKGAGSTSVRTVFRTVRLPRPRFELTPELATQNSEALVEKMLFSITTLLLCTDGS